MASACCPCAARAAFRWCSATMSRGSCRRPGRGCPISDPAHWFSGSSRRGLRRARLARRRAAPMAAHRAGGQRPRRSGRLALQLHDRVAGHGGRRPLCRDRQGAECSRQRRGRRPRSARAAAAAPLGRHSDRRRPPTEPRSLCRSWRGRTRGSRVPGHGSLPADFAAVLNFGSWEDDALLAGYLERDALGYATTVHPLLGNFDRHGFLRALWTTRRQKAAGRAVVKARSASARYTWTVFRPSGAALDALAEGVSAGWLELPVGIAAALDDARAGFAHVEAGKPGRAVLRLGDR